MDTNTNFQTYNGNISNLLGRKLSYGDLVGLDNSLGNPAGNQPTFISNGNIYQTYDAGSGQFGVRQIDTVANRQGEQAQQTFQAQQGSAISTLQTGKQNLAGQYADLLKTVTGEYQPLIDQATLQQNAQNASRGLVSNVGNGGTQMISALNPIYSAQAANAQQIGQGSLADTAAYTNAISQAQSGLATGNLNAGLEYGSLALNASALPSQIALAQAQAGLAGAQAKTAQFLPNYTGLTFNTGNSQANVLGQGLNLSPATLQAALASMGL